MTHAARRATPEAPILHSPSGVIAASSRSRKRRDSTPLSPRDMLVFAAIARSGGVRSAADALGIPRSNVSRQLAELERAAGAKLVTRTSRRFSLTELGKRLLEKCEELETLMESSARLIAQSAQEPTGILTVAVSPVAGDELLADPIREYLQRHPAVRVDVRVSPEFVDLRRSGVDLAVRTGPLQSAADLYAVKLATYTKGTFASPEYLARRGTPSHPRELIDHDAVVVGSVAAQGWSFNLSGEQAYARVTPRVRSDSYRLARSAAADGAGIVRLPEFYAADLVAQRRLVPVLERFAPKLTLYAVHAASVPAPPKIRSFIELLKASFSRRLNGRPSR